MIIGNFKSTEDKTAKKNLQNSLLEVEIANETESERRQKDFKNPYKPKEIAPQIRTNAELQKDRIEQERQAIANMNELGFDYQKGAELSAWLSSSAINKLIAFNANFKGIKKELVETTNPKLLNLDFLKNYLEKYFEDMDINYGRKFGRTEQSGTPAPSTIDELQAILPDITELETLYRELGLLFGSTLEFQNSILGNIRNIDREAEDIAGNNAIKDTPEDEARMILDLQRKMSEAEDRGDRGAYDDLMRRYTAMTQKTGVARNVRLGDEELKRKLIKLTGNKKSLEAELKDVVDLRNDIVKAQNLTKLYIAIVPTPETLNLIKMSLTQQERGDLIRRYIIVIRKLNILSNSGINELTDEVGDFAIDDYDGIKRFIRKTLNSLAFISNDEGVNQLTRLQRDYEMLLKQNGKVGEIDKIKRLNDIKETEILMARDNLKNIHPINLEEIIRVGEHLNNPNARTVMDAEDIIAERERLAEIENNISETREAQRIKNLIGQYERDYIAEQGGRNRPDVLERIQADANPLISELDLLTELRPAQYIARVKQAEQLSRKLTEEGGIAEEIRDIVVRINELYDKWRDGTITPKEKAEIEYLENLARKKDERQYIKEKKQQEFETELGQELNEYGTQKTRLRKGTEYRSDVRRREAELITPQAVEAETQRRRNEVKENMRKYYRDLDEELAVARQQSGKVRENINDSLEETINNDPKFAGFGEEIERKRGETVDAYYERLINKLHNYEQQYIDSFEGDEIFTEPQRRRTPITYVKGAKTKSLIRGVGVKRKPRKKTKDSDSDSDNYKNAINRLKVSSKKAEKIAEEMLKKQYGKGVRQKLRKHFKEDEQYLLNEVNKVKDIENVIDRHIKETEPLEQRITKGLNGLGFKHTRIKVGRGITATEQPQYKTFGKYVIHYGHLIDKNIANFKYPSLGSIPAIKPVNITDDYKDFIIDTINTGKANERALNKLSTDEKKHFERVIIGAGLLETFNLKRGYDGDEKKDADRFILLRGEVMAGNNNDKLLKELKLLIIKLMSNGRIQRNEGHNMLVELSVI